MAFIPTPNAVSVSLRYLWDSQRVENTLSFYRAEGWTEAIMNNLANIMVSWHNNTLKSLQATTLGLTEVYVVDQSAEDAPAITATAPGGLVPGTGGTASLPNNTTLAIQFRTAFRGRTGRGRNFILGLQEGQVANNEIATSPASAWLAAYEGMPVLVEDIDAQHVIISRQLDNAPRPTGLVRLVTAYAFSDLIVDSQRRRLPGRGA